MAVYSTLNRINRIFDTVCVMNITPRILTDTSAPLDLATLDAASQAAAAAFVAAGTAPNTVRSYRGARTPFWVWKTFWSTRQMPGQPSEVHVRSQRESLEVA